MTLLIYLYKTKLSIHIHIFAQKNEKVYSKNESFIINFSFLALSTIRKNYIESHLILHPDRVEVCLT